MPSIQSHASRFSFIGKVGATLSLVILAHWLFFGQWWGATLSLIALAWCALLAIAVPAMRRRAPAMALAIAAAFGIAMIEQPTLLGWVLFWSAIASAALLPRRRFDDAATWAVRLLTFGLIGIFSPIRDALHILRLPSQGRVTVKSVATVLALPLLGGAFFFALFAVANPVIRVALNTISLPPFAEVASRLIFWTFIVVTVWPAFRPRGIRFAGGLIRDHARVVDLPVATLSLSLAAFNAVFAMQNALDIVFLWSGSPLPEGVTLAEYAHQGAYALIATALLAGAFVLVALAPGSRAARNVTVRRLLVLWIAQNILLVASSILRLLDYIAAYSLTELRIAALVWMGLVAVGLALICWRLLAGRSAAWLVNANALAAGLTLAVSSVVDYGAVAATWNVDHVREAKQLDLCYLNSLGPSALLPLIDLERRAGGPILLDQARYLRRGIQSELTANQADWHQWTFRNARRLAQAEMLVGEDSAPLRPALNGRGCDGSIVPPPPPETSAADTAPSPDATMSPPPLTNGSEQ